MGGGEAVSAPTMQSKAKKETGKWKRMSNAAAGQVGITDRNEGTDGIRGRSRGTVTGDQRKDQVERLS